MENEPVIYKSQDIVSLHVCLPRLLPLLCMRDLHRRDWVCIPLPECVDRCEAKLQASSFMAKPQEAVAKELLWKMRCSTSLFSVSVHIGIPCSVQLCSAYVFALDRHLQAI